MVIQYFLYLAMLTFLYLVMGIYKPSPKPITSLYWFWSAFFYVVIFIPHALLPGCQDCGDQANDSNGEDQMILPIESKEQHGYVVVDLQHIVSSIGESSKQSR